MHFSAQEELDVVADCDLPRLGRDLAPSRTCCRRQLRAATKPTDAIVRVIRKKVRQSRLSQTVLLAHVLLDYTIYV